MTRTISIDTWFTRAIVALVAALMLAIVAGPAKAHHGWSDYDSSQRTTITGTISESHFGNPHVTIVVSAGGKSWNVMLAAPSRLQSRGCSPDMLAVGQAVTVEVLPHRMHADDFRAERLTVHGMTIELR